MVNIDQLNRDIEQFGKAVQSFQRIDIVLTELDTIKDYIEASNNQIVTIEGRLQEFLTEYRKFINIMKQNQEEIKEEIQQGNKDTELLLRNLLDMNVKSMENAFNVSNQKLKEDLIAEVNKSNELIEKLTEKNERLTKIVIVSAICSFAALASAVLTMII